MPVSFYVAIGTKISLEEDDKFIMSDVFSYSSSWTELCSACEDAITDGAVGPFFLYEAVADQESATHAIMAAATGGIYDCVIQLKQYLGEIFP